MTDKLSLHGKLAQVMYEAERIPKNGQYTGPGSFKFVQAGDAADVIRKALAEQRVSMVPSGIELISEAEHETKSGATMTTMTVRTTWTLTDADSGETAVIQSMGSGADTGDKAIPKAQTNAMKYALLMGFLLSTGDDPELHDTSDRQRRPSPSSRMGAVIPADPKPIARPTHDGSLIGVAELAKDFLDFLPKQGPDGMVLAFKLKAQGGIKVIAKGQLAEALVPLRDSIIGQRVSVWGRVRDETFRPKGSTKDVTYAVCDLERIQTADGTLPAPELAEPPDDVPLVGEAPPLFDDVETVPAA